ncbi:MAG: hypothetical protein WBQ24_22175 [Xanthobacteraceae bacterium]
MHKFFSGRARRRAGVSAGLKSGAKTAPRRRPPQRDLEIGKQRKPHFIGTFSHRENSARNLASKKTFCFVS